MNETTKLSIAIALGLAVLTTIWVTSGELDNSAGSSIVRGQYDASEAASLGPILFVVVLGLIVWMAYGIGEYNQIQSLTKIMFSKANSQVRSLGKARTMDREESPKLEEEDNDDDDDLQVIRELKRSMQKEQDYDMAATTTRTSHSTLN